MLNNVSILTRENSTKIKGIALFMMFFHHFLTFPGWYVTGWTFDSAQFFSKYFNMPSQLCVSIFAFLTGYLYASHKDKTLKYSLRKGISLYIDYWLLILLTIAIIEILSRGSWSMSWDIILLNFLCVRQDLSFFGWYVSFYFISMIFLSVIEKFTDHSSLFFDTILYILIPPAVLTILYNVFVDRYPVLFNFFYRLYNMFPVMGCGAVCAYHSVFAHSFDHAFKNAGKGKKTAFLFLMIFLVFVFQYYSRTVTLVHVDMQDAFNADITVSMGIIYAPVLVYCFDQLISLLHIPYLDKALYDIGNNSMLMWLISGMFFTQVLSSSGFQSLLTLPKNPALVLIWALVLTYIPAVILKKPFAKISSFLTRWLV